MNCNWCGDEIKSGLYENHKCIEENDERVKMLYSFRYNEVSMNQVWFEAKDDEEAKSLMKQLMEDEININDLPEVGERNRGIDLDFSVSILECEDENFRVVELEN